MGCQSIDVSVVIHIVIPIIVARNVPPDYFFLQHLVSIGFKHANNGVKYVKLRVHACDGYPGMLRYR